MAQNQPPHPQSIPPPPAGFAAPPVYAYGQTQPLDPLQAAPNVIVEPQPMVMTGPDQVPDNMVISIVSIIFCPIIGIIATIMANRANNLKNVPGCLEQAKRGSANAEKLAILALLLGFFLGFIGVMLNFVIPFIIGTMAFAKVLGFFKSLV